MEALYGDLENYNEVYIIEELRSENRDLKLKLEEYETAIGKLQKDYDKLVLEFNNLQTNYSSLLKTARAEVERKAQMITQLNTDKDMMVLKTLQNGNNRRFQNRLQNNTRNPIKTTNRETDKANVGKKTKPEHSVKNEQCQASISTNVSVPESDNTKLLNIVDKVVEKVEASVSKGELKENVAESPKTPASSIKSRRKSLPASNISQLSTDEEHESDKIGNPILKNEMLPIEIGGTSDINERVSKITNERLSNKTSDTTSLSGRSSNYQEPARDGYRSATSRHSDCEKFRSDRIRESDRFTEKIDKYKEVDKFRESYKYRKDDKILDVGQTREVDKYSDINKFREGDKCRDINKFRESSKYRDGDKFREDVKLREGEKFRESQKVREGEKFNEHEKYGECDYINRHSDKYRMGDKCREYDKFRESDRYRQSDKHRLNDKYREGDKLKEEGKYWHTEKFRNRDKFDPSYRYRRHYSPDRPYKRNYRECQDNYKQEYGRDRVSPPSESHSLPHQRSHDKQLFYEDQRHKSDKYKHHYELTHAESLSLSDNQIEPCKKRQKFEYEIHVEENRNHHDREPVIKPSCSMEYDMLYASCQSPDAVFSPDSHMDTPIGHTIREIKSTAVTPLEDPRKASKRYVLKTENGITTLSTAASKCIDIKPVDKSLWNIQSVAMPDALLHEPQSYFGEESVKEIYMDIDNPESNVSVETGEIVEDTFSSSSVNHEKRSQVNDINKKAADVVSTQKSKPENVQKITTTCKIPEEMPIKQQITVSDLPKDLPKIVCDDNLTKKVVKDNQCSDTPQSSLPQIDEHENSVPDTNIYIYKNKRDRHNKISLSEMAMVQDDLELSDETSDNLDTHKQIVIEKEVLHQEQSTVVGEKGNDLDSEPKYHFKIAPEANVEIVGITTNENLKECDGHKKQKSKRRKTKSKDKVEDEKNNDINVTEKKIKSKKEKEVKPKQMKNKFTDLFGDSSSLITPEDLGIPTSCVPLCEDAQDAVDINIKETVAPQSCANNVILNEIVQDTNLGDTNIKDKKIAKSIEEHVSPHIDKTNQTLNIVYQNLNAEADVNKPDIVKTVIISSGVQPQFILDREEKTTEDRGAKVDVNKQNNVEFHQLPADTEFKKQISLKALATSTPHKEFPVQNTMEPNCVNISNDSKSGSIDTIRPVVNQSNINTQESLDAPDVRIFVRRRRKGVKKP